MKKPQQPKDHEYKCFCAECERWAAAYVDWQEHELEEGRNPWASEQSRSPGFLR